MIRIIHIPDNLTKKLKNKKKLSAPIAVKEKLERINKEKLDKLLIEGYKATRKEDKEINQEWEKITLEGWR